MRTGQKLLIYGILLNLGALLLQLTRDRALLIVAGIAALMAIALAVLGILPVSSGLKYHGAVRVICCVLTIVPLVNLVMLLILNGQASAALRAEGHEVGLLGAKERRWRR